MGRTVEQKWNLLTGQDSYAGQNAQDPRTSRKILSWIPQDDGQLHRELPEPAYLPTTLSGPVVGIYEFDQNSGSGTITRFYFAAARTDFTVGTKTCNFYKVTGGAWVAVAAVGTLVDAPACVTQENNFFVSDGVSNFLFNGTIWVNVGINFPLGQPAITTSAGTPQVYFDSAGVTCYFFSTSAAIQNPQGFKGTVSLQYPITPSAATATVTKSSAGGASLLFNPQQFNGTVDPSVLLQWATLNASGAITGYTQPWSGAIPPSGGSDVWQMAVVCNLVIPTPGNYNITMAHDDGAIFGFGPGKNKGGAPALVSSTSNNQYTFQTVTAMSISGGAGNPVLGGTSHSGNWNDTFVVNFPNADTYNLEIDYMSWENQQQLTFQIGSAANGGAVTNPLPSVSTNPGNITAALGRYYWYTNADQTVGVITESSSSPIGSISGALVGGSVNVYQQPGLFTSSLVSATVTGGSSTDTPGPVAPQLNSTMAGQVLYINGTKIGTILSVSGNNITLTGNALAAFTSGRAVICDARCTHWHVYASESDGSKIGQYLAAVPVTQNLSSTPYTDTSPFLSDVTNTFLPIFRPVRNDQPPPSKLLEVHKVRQFRRRESSPNFFNFTANEEVTSGNNGDPAQCMPGANVNTVSDMVNEVSFPDQSARLRGLVSHMDSLYMFSEKQCYPLYGQSVDDFAISQNIAFALGLAGRFAAKSTPNGLVFVSYDRRAFLYPTSLYSSYLAQGGAATSALIEIGKPLRNVLKTIAPSRLDEVVTAHYHFGIRDWWIVSFPTSAATDAPQTWVYDFSGKGWFQLSRGFTSLAVFEVGEGNLVLIGGAADGNTYVVDDQTGTYSPTGNLPASTWQPALIDFGNPDTGHVFRRLELEFDSAALAQAAQITVWLDPLNVDSPGVGRAVHLKPALGANRYAGFLTDQGGAVCQRMLLQVYVPANTISGVVRGIKLIADTATGFIGGSNRVGGV